MEINKTNNMLCAWPYLLIRATLIGCQWHHLIGSIGLIFMSHPCFPLPFDDNTSNFSIGSCGFNGAREFICTSNRSNVATGMYHWIYLMDVIQLYIQQPHCIQWLSWIHWEAIECKILKWLWTKMMVKIQPKYAYSYVIQCKIY